MSKAALLRSRLKKLPHLKKHKRRSKMTSDELERLAEQIYVRTINRAHKPKPSRPAATAPLGPPGPLVPVSRGRMRAGPVRPHMRPPAPRPSPPRPPTPPAPPAPKPKPSEPPKPKPPAPPAPPAPKPQPKPSKGPMKYDRETEMALERDWQKFVKDYQREARKAEKEEDKEITALKKKLADLDKVPHSKSEAYSIDQWNKDVDDIRQAMEEEDLHQRLEKLLEEPAGVDEDDLEKRWAKFEHDIEVGYQEAKSAQFKKRLAAINDRLAKLKAKREVREAEFNQRAEQARAASVSEEVPHIDSKLLEYHGRLKELNPEIARELEEEWRRLHSSGRPPQTEFDVEEFEREYGPRPGEHVDTSGLDEVAYEQEFGAPPESGDLLRQIEADIGDIRRMEGLPPLKKKGRGMDFESFVNLHPEQLQHPKVFKSWLAEVRKKAKKGGALAPLKPFIDQVLKQQKFVSKAELGKGGARRSRSASRPGRGSKEIRTLLGSEEHLGPQALIEAKLKEGQKPFKKTKKANITEYLLAKYGKKKDKKKAKKPGKKKGKGGECGGDDDDDHFGGEMMEDVRYTVKEPYRLEYKPMYQDPSYREGVHEMHDEAPEMYPEYTEGLHQGEGLTYATHEGDHKGNWNPRGSLNPPLDYNALNYSAYLPLGPHRNSNLPWYEPGKYGQFGVGGAQEGPYFPPPRYTKQYYYQADTVPASEFEPLMAKSASLENPYQLNNVSESHILQYPRTGNSGRQGEWEETFRPGIMNPDAVGTANMYPAVH